MYSCVQLHAAMYSQSVYMHGADDLKETRGLLEEAVAVLNKVVSRDAMRCKHVMQCDAR